MDDKNCSQTLNRTERPFKTRRLTIKFQTRATECIMLDISTSSSEGGNLSILNDDQRERSVTPPLSTAPIQKEDDSSSDNNSSKLVMEDNATQDLRRGIDKSKTVAAKLLDEARKATLKAQQCEEVRIKKLNDYRRASDDCVQAAEEAKSAILRARIAEEQLEKMESQLVALLKGDGSSSSQQQQKIRLLKPALLPLPSTTTTTTTTRPAPEGESTSPSNKRVRFDDGKTKENDLVDNDAKPAETNADNGLPPWMLDPADIRNWKRIRSRSQNRYYYYNIVTKETSWVPPTQMQRLGILGGGGGDHNINNQGAKIATSQGTPPEQAAKTNIGVLATMAMVGDAVQKAMAAADAAEVAEKTATVMDKPDPRVGWKHRFSTSKQLFCYFNMDRKLAFFSADPPARVFHPTKFVFYAANARSFNPEQVMREKATTTTEDK